MIEQINAAQVKNSNSTKIMLLDPGGAGIAADTNITLPTGFDTETNKFHVFVNTTYVPSFATNVGGAGTVYKGTASSQIKFVNVLAAGDLITLIKIPGITNNTSLFTDTAGGSMDTWV